MQAGQCLTAMRGSGAPDVRICYDRAESLCHSLNRPLLLYSALIGQWRYTLMTDKMSAAMHVAERVYSLAQEQKLLGFLYAECCTRNKAIEPGKIFYICK